MRRRRFLQSLAALLRWVWQPTAAFALGVAFGEPKQRLEPLERVHQLLGAMRVGPAATMLGREYLARCPEEADIGVLLAALDSCTADGMPGSKEMGAQEQRRREALDFASGHVVELSGWLLSQREARICALASLV